MSNYGQEEIFSAWPKDWDCEFKLLALGAFIVTSAQEGKIQFVKLHSNEGGVCRLENPWNEEQVTLYREGKKSESEKGYVLKFNNCKRQKYNYCQRRNKTGRI